jgi:hypothetical protein
MAEVLLRLVVGGVALALLAPLQVELVGFVVARGGAGEGARQAGAALGGRQAGGVQDDAGDVVDDGLALKEEKKERRERLGGDVM